jgi:hypothetical protein
MTTASVTLAQAACAAGPSETGYHLRFHAVGDNHRLEGGCRRRRGNGCCGWKADIQAVPYRMLCDHYQCAVARHFGVQKVRCGVLLVGPLVGPRKAGLTGMLIALI